MNPEQKTIEHALACTREIEHRREPVTDRALRAVLSAVRAVAKPQAETLQQSWPAKGMREALYEDIKKRLEEKRLAKGDFNILRDCSERYDYAQHIKEHEGFSEYLERYERHTKAMAESVYGKYGDEGLMYPAQQDQGMLFSNGPLGSSPSSPYSLQLKTLVDFFAARWPEQVHFHTAYLENPSFFRNESGSTYVDEINQQIAKLDPGYQSEDNLPRQPRLVAQTWIWVEEISAQMLGTQLIDFTQWQTDSVMLMRLAAQQEALRWSSSLNNPRLYWRLMPEVTTVFSPETDTHRIKLRLRCALEGSDARSPCTG